jgi:hypothetical protein
VIHIPTAFYVLGVFAVLYTVACVIYAKPRSRNYLASAKDRVGKWLVLLEF